MFKESGDFLQFHEENWKKYRIISKTDIWADLYEIWWFPWQREKYGEAKFPQRMKEQLLKASAPLRVNQIFKTLKKT